MHFSVLARFSGVLKQFFDSNYWFVYGFVKVQEPLKETQTFFKISILEEKNQ